MDAAILGGGGCGVFIYEEGREGNNESVRAEEERDLTKERVMGAERLSDNQHHQVDEAEAEAAAPFIVGLQPSALVDTVARVDSSFLDLIRGEHGGSIPVCIIHFASIHLFTQISCSLLLFSCSINRLALKNSSTY